MLLKSKNNIDWVRIIAPLALLVATFFVTHIPRLGTDEMNPDAINWHSRSEQYINAIKDRDFIKTYQSYHPGVTLMMLIGFPVEVLKRTSNPPLIYDRSSYEVFHLVAKYVLNIALLILIIILIFLTSKILNFWIAYFFGLFLTIEPFFLGNSRLLHLDALLSLLSMCALLTFYLYFKERKYKWVVISAFFMGLSFWTKNVSVLASVYLIGVLTLLLILKEISFKRYLINVMTYLSLFILVGYLIFPALWINPIKIFKKIINKSSNVVEMGHEEKFFGVKTMNPGPRYYPIVLAFKFSPLIFVLLVFSSIYFPVSLFKERKRLMKSKYLVLYYLLLFCLCYFLAMELALKKIDRYMLPMYPPILLTTSYVLFGLIRRFKYNLVVLFVLFIGFFFSLQPLISYFPYYFVYNSPLFGGGVMAEKIIGQKSFGVGIFAVRDFILKNYGYINVGIIDRKGMAATYPSSMVFDARVYGSKRYSVLVLDSDDDLPDELEGKFIYDKSIMIGGVKFWNFYVKKT